MCSERRILAEGFGVYLLSYWVPDGLLPQELLFGGMSISTEESGRTGWGCPGILDLHVETQWGQ